MHTLDIAPLRSEITIAEAIRYGTCSQGKLKELDREDAQKRPGGIVLRMTWKVYACPKRMCSPGINGEGELRG